jgi:hypothetical protein
LQVPLDFLAEFSFVDEVIAHGGATAHLKQVTSITKGLCCHSGANTVPLLDHSEFLITRIFERGKTPLLTPFHLPLFLREFHSPSAAWFGFVLTGFHDGQTAKTIMLLSVFLGLTKPMPVLARTLFTLDEQTARYIAPWH